MKYENLAKDIISRVGGKENINSLTHCITRLRFKLKDESIAKTDELKNMDGVVTVIQAGGQYQVVIGNHVPQVYEAVMAIAGISSGVVEDAPGEKQGLFNTLVDTISGCFQPFLGVLCAAGMVKGILALLTFFDLIDAESGTALMLDAVGDSVFYFMPFIIAVTAARKFKLNEFVGLALAGSLLYPTMQLSALGEAGDLTILGLPFMAQDYANSVIPIIIVVLLASKINRFFKRFIPEMVSAFVVPMLTLLVTMPITFLVIGPVINALTTMLSNGFDAIFVFSPVIFGLIIGFLWQILVIFGLHWALVPMGIMQLSDLGFTTILAMIGAVSFAQTAVVIALYFKIKDTKFRGLAIPAIISGFFGVTEPAIYAITLPRKKTFMFSCIGAGLAGMYAGANGLTQWMMGGLGVFTFPAFIAPDGSMADVITLAISIVIAMVSSFLLTMFFYKEKETEVKENQIVSFQNVDANTLLSPLAGEVKPLTEAPDAAFAEGHMGQGVVIEPTVGEVRAPFNGTVAALFPTKHAVGLMGENGMEVLIHVGMDTVSLEGKGFEAMVKMGDKVEAGQLMIKFDIETIKKAGLVTSTPVIITNSQSYKEINATSGKISAGQELISVK